MAILDLTTYKDYKGISSTTEDTQNTNTINAVNTFIEAYTGRVFTTYNSTGVDKTEYFEANESEIYPIEHPILSITSFDYSTDAGQNYGNALAEYTDYVIDETDESIQCLKTQFADVTHKINALRLVYRGGFDTIPEDLQLAAVHLTDYYKDEEYIPRKSMAGVSVDTVIQPDMSAKLPAHIRRVLEHYRNIVF